MSEHQFGLDTSTLGETAPILPEGFYAAEITNAGVRFGDKDLYSLNIRKVLEYTKGSREGKDTGKIEIAGYLGYGVALKSKKAIKILQRDNPIFFGGRITYKVDENFRALPSHVLGQFLGALKLKDVDYNELTGWEFDESLDLEAFALQEFPDEGNAEQKADNAVMRERILNHPKALTLANALLFHRAYLNAIGKTVDGTLCRAHIKQQANYKNPELKENAIELGTFAAPFCGILEYKDGCENDLPEE